MNAATFAVARIVEQNLVAIDPGVIDDHDEGRRLASDGTAKDRHG